MLDYRLKSVYPCFREPVCLYLLHTDWYPSINLSSARIMFPSVMYLSTTKCVIHLSGKAIGVFIAGSCAVMVWPHWFTVNHHLPEMMKNLTTAPFTSQDSNIWYYTAELCLEDIGKGWSVGGVMIRECRSKWKGASLFGLGSRPVAMEGRCISWRARLFWAAQLNAVERPAVAVNQMVYCKNWGRGQSERGRDRTVTDTDG